MLSLGLKLIYEFCLLVLFRIILGSLFNRTCRRRGPQTKAPRRAIMWDDEELEPLAEITQKVDLKQHETCA